MVAHLYKPTHFLTADIVFGFWVSLLLKILHRSKIVLMPVCLPKSICENLKNSLGEVAALMANS